MSVAPNRLQRTVLYCTYLLTYCCAAKLICRNLTLCLRLFYSTVTNF